MSEAHIPPNPIADPADAIDLPPPPHPGALAITALVIGNVVLALGAWSVRLADCGPVSAGFWRLLMALPVLAVLARANRQQVFGLPRQTALTLAAAGVFFALDLVVWHIGIPLTKLGNATLFGNCSAFVLMIWGLIAQRRLPRGAEALALAGALAGGAILMGRSLEVSPQTAWGDTLCVLAGLFYVGYIVLLRHARGRLGNWAAVVRASLAGAPVMLAIALLRGEPVWPGGGPNHAALMLHGWGPLVMLALGSQVLGQGLLAYALGKFSPVIIGMSLLLQPAIAVLAGWLTFGEAVGPVDALGMVLVAGALVLAGVGARR